MKSLHKALDILDLIAERGSLGIRELSSLTGFPVGTTHRIVSTLAKRRLLAQDPVARSYSLSLRFLELGTRVQQHFNLTSIARPHLERLMKESGESANMAVLDGDEAVYVDNVRSNHMLQLFTRLGARVPLYATGVGKMFLSRLSDEELKEYMGRTKMTSRTPRTIVKKDHLKTELAAIGRNGYAVDNEEMEEGVRCVAALVFDHRGRPAAAVSLSGAATRITEEKVEFFAEKVKECCRRISEALGFDQSVLSNQNKTE
jgi:DNA-binding IclR family transcriptional regulator